jgi:hypothetical protein
MALYADKILSWIGAGILLAAGFFAAYMHHWMWMAGFFIVMGYCLGFALRGRNTWMM